MKSADRNIKITQKYQLYFYLIYQFMRPGFVWRLKVTLWLRVT